MGCLLCCLPPNLDGDEDPVIMVTFLRGILHLRRGRLYPNIKQTQDEGRVKEDILFPPLEDESSKSPHQTEARYSDSGLTDEVVFTYEETYGSKKENIGKESSSRRETDYDGASQVNFPQAEDGTSIDTERTDIDLWESSVTAHIEPREEADAELTGQVTVSVGLSTSADVLSTNSVMSDSTNSVSLEKPSSLPSTEEKQKKKKPRRSLKLRKSFRESFGKKYVTRKRNLEEEGLDD